MSVSDQMVNPTFTRPPEQTKTGRIALITGASSGIGRDMARELFRRGCSLILVARREDRLLGLKQELLARPVRAGQSVQIIASDLARAENCYALFSQVKGQNVDILINNAGFGLFGPFSEAPFQEELRMIDTNVRAVHILTKLFLQDFCKRNSGYLLNVASAAAFLPGPLLAGYYASKSYVLRLSEAIYEELRRSGSRVSVSVLCPGPVRTEFDSVAGVRFSVKGLSSARVARCAIDGMFAHKLVITPGALMKCVRVAQRLAPEKVLLRACWHMQKRKGNA